MNDAKYLVPLTHENLALGHFQFRKYSVESEISEKRESVITPKRQEMIDRPLGQSCVS